MNPFDLESIALFDGFDELEEGVYFKHYGMKLLSDEAEQGYREIDSFGDYEAKALLWQKQIEANADCIALKTIADNSLNGVETTQADIKREAIARGFFQLNCGASFDDVIKILELDASTDAENSIRADVFLNMDLSELIEYMGGDEDIICYVNRIILDCGDSFCFPRLNADGFIHVIGIEFCNDECDYIVINDVSKDHGAGIRIPLDRFLKAWSTSDYTVIIVSRR